MCTMNNSKSKREKGNGSTAVKHTKIHTLWKLVVADRRQSMCQILHYGVAAEVLIFTIDCFLITSDQVKLSKSYAWH